MSWFTDGDAESWAGEEVRSPRPCWHFWRKRYRHFALGLRCLRCAARGRPGTRRYHECHPYIDDEVAMTVSCRVCYRDMTGEV